MDAPHPIIKPESVPKVRGVLRKHPPDMFNMIYIEMDISEEPYFAVRDTMCSRWSNCLFPNVIDGGGSFRIASENRN